MDKFEVVSLNEGCILVLKATTSVSAEDINHQLTQLASSREFAYAAKLWDFTATTLAPFSQQDINSLAFEHQAMLESKPSCSNAILVSDNLSFGIGRVYQAHAELAGLTAKIEIFRDRDEALTWLNQCAEDQGRISKNG